MDKSWICLPKWDPKYAAGVWDFVQFVMANANGNTIHYCPCIKCQCRSDLYHFDIETVWEHLTKNGFWDKYTCWIYHGEISSAGPHDHGQFSERASTSNYDPTTRLINDVFRNESGGVFDQIPDVDSVQQFPRPVNTACIDKYNKLISFQRTPLYDGCMTTVLESVMGVMKLKVENKLTVKAVDDYLDLSASFLPPGHRLPTSHHFEDLDACPLCHTDRYKLTAAGNKKAVKILWYFPLIERLVRLYMSAHTAKAMRWHVEKDLSEDDTLRHPADGEAIKHIDREYPQFSSDVRNARLGLSTDRFNPFGNMSLQYSIWPVILLPYNLPPWMCMKKEYNMLTMLIPGPGYPGKCLDVYLRPLIEELKLLNYVGHPTYDAYRQEMFQMHAMLVGTISDFPARGMLSGNVVKGYMGCPECLTDDFGRLHCRKIVHMRHRCWLGLDHQWREDDKAFDGTVENDVKPRKWMGDELLEVLNEYDFGPLSNHPNIMSAIPDRPDRYKFWTHKSIFWELPYWSKLLIRHYLDVMHIEKNMCESVVGTVLNWEGKTKDGPKARIDVKQMNIRRDLWLKEGKKKMPQAPYTIKPDQKNEIFTWLSTVKYPSGYAGNIDRCVNFRDNKIYGLKSHDCHILLQRLFPIFIRSYLSRQVVEPLVALSRFFQKLCTREVKKTDLREMQDDIIYIMCKFERIFPPNFFDIKPHQMIHLPEQLLLTGPVHYTWMYLIERQLGEYKDYVANKSAPEGCIAEAYLAHECVTYTRLYLGALEEPPENMPVDEQKFKFSILSYDVEVYGKLPASYQLKSYELVIAHWWVLINCPEVQYWKDIHLYCDEVAGDLEYHNREFANYFGVWMNHIQFDGHHNWSHELRLLAMKPITSRVYPMCKVNVVQFICESRDLRRRTQNSGVFVHGGQNGIDYYGVIHSVVELFYGEGMTLHLLKCRWFDTNPQNTKTDQYGIFSVNTATRWYEDDPFVFATSVKQVFYLDDLAAKEPWKVVNHVVPRNIYSAATLGESRDNEKYTAYQEPNSHGIPDSSTTRLNNVRHGRVVRNRDVDPNEDIDQDSSDEDRHILPEISSGTEEDSSDDSNYAP